MREEEAGGSRSRTESQAREASARPPISVGIVDNDPVVVKSLAAMFGDTPTPVGVLWSVCSAREALLCCESPDMVPDVLLTDVSMPGMGGFELARRVRAGYPGVCVVAVTAFGIETVGADPQDSGVSAVLRKEATLQEYVRAIARASGRDDLAGWRERSWSFVRMMLTETEVAVLSEYLRGRTTSAVARLLHMSEGTVKTHTNNAYRKMGVHSRAEAIRICVREHIL